MASFFIIAVLASTIIGYVAYRDARIALRNESFDKLTAVREMKADQIEDYLHGTEEAILLFSKDPTVIQAMIEFKKGYDLLETELNYDSTQLKQVNGRVIQYLEEEFIPRLEVNLEGNADLSKETTKDLKAQMLQDLYIAANPNPVGSKLDLLGSNAESSYDSAHVRYHPHLKNHLESFGFYDIFLVDDQTGRIIYSVYKEVDYATSLIDGPFKETNIADAFLKAKNAGSTDMVFLEDYQPYHPSYNANAAFISSPIFDGEEKVGVLIFQMPINRIDSIMTNKQHWKEMGLGESGETYIVGEDHKLRNQSRFLIEDSTNYFAMIKQIGVEPSVIQEIRNFNSTVGLQTVKTIGTEAALSGKEDTKTFDDYRGVSVLSSYKPLQINGMNWVIMSEIDSAEAFSSVVKLRNKVFIVFSGLVIFILFLSYFSAKTMTRPLKKLSLGAKRLSRGNWDTDIDLDRKDEIGLLAISFKKMQIAIKNLISELQDINANLEEKVINRTLQIEKQKELVEKKSQQITDSIMYAKRLQEAILPPKKEVLHHLNQSFILYLPKHIVSGDFYWMHVHEDQLLIAAVDCTGHGVPGAMVSVVGANGLNRCVNEFGLLKPSDILDKLRELVIETFEKSDDDVKDGMDIALCNINLKTNKVQYAGAHNPLWILREKAQDVETIKASKQPIGKFVAPHPFENHEIELKKGDRMYLFSDGFSDQFGGAKQKKFGSRRMREFLLSLKGTGMIDQEEIILDTFNDWKGANAQIDDVCLIGIEV